jgi:cobalamin-dependent methionine synthase I
MTYGQQYVNAVFLVLCHIDGMSNAKISKNPYDLRYRWLDHELRGRGSDCGGNGTHDRYCHCLRVMRKTYKTREAADEAAAQLERENPENCYWSLEVQAPE